MKLSISNIAWPEKNEQEMYAFLSTHHFKGLEIAPTRIFQTSPYEYLSEARSFALKLKKDYGLDISSMQSIWYGVTQSIFGPDSDRQFLINHTKKAIEFASTINCQNLVFGCPKNRNIPVNMDATIYLPIVYDFFNQIGEYAYEHKTCLAIEPNPPIYNTNFINTTKEAFDLCKKINNPNIKVNIDLGTLIYNNENISLLKDNISLINHVHISEPHLVSIQKRELHKELIHELRNAGYEKYLSIEMGLQSDVQLVKDTVLYIKELCNDI